MIRRVIASDAASLAALDAEVFGAEAYPVQAIRQFYDLAPDLQFTDVDPLGEPVGYAIGGLTVGDGTGWLLTLAVRRSARGAGVGRRLSLAVLEALSLAGAAEGRLCVHPDNVAALRLYYRMGFVQCAAEDEYFGPEEPRLVLTRAL